jgi:hypothetical protein
MARGQGGEKKKKTKISTNMKTLRDNAFINTEMATTKMAMILYVYINPCPASDN